MSQSPERNDETPRGQDRHSFPVTPKKTGRDPPNMPKFPPPPPQYTNNINTGDSAPVDNTPITNEQYTNLMAQYQTMAREWAQYTKQMKKQQRKGPLHSDEVILLSSRQNEVQSSSTKGINKKFKGEAKLDEANTPYTE